MKRTLAGLSLIELLIALTITIILAVVAVPAFIDLYSTHYLRSNTENLYTTLQFAQSEAIKNNQTVYVNFQTGSNWCYGARLGSTCSCSTLNSCTLANYTNNNQSLSLATTGISSGNLTFDSMHGATGTSGTLTFTHSATSKSITIKFTALGNMQYCSATISGYGACS